MNIEDLKQIDKRYRIEKPRLFEIEDPDSQASDEQLEDVERSLGVRLPPSYRAFLREFGGGTTMGSSLFFLLIHRANGTFQTNK